LIFLDFTLFSQKRPHLGRFFLLKASLVKKTCFSHNPI
jgi:hypothetical protein